MDTFMFTNNDVHSASVADNTTTFGNCYTISMGTFGFVYYFLLCVTIEWFAITLLHTWGFVKNNTLLEVFKTIPLACKCIFTLEYVA